MALELLFLGTGTSTGVPMIGCRCGVCTSDDPRDRRTRPSVLVRYPRPGRLHEHNGQATTAPPPFDTHSPSSAAAPPPGGPPAPPDRVQVLIDVTPDIRDQAIREGLDWLDAVVLTHAHADHTMGIDDLRRFNAIMDAPLDLYAEPNVHEQLNRMFGHIFDTAHPPSTSFVAQLMPLPVQEQQPIALLGATWTPIRLMHGRLPIVGYRVDWNGRSIAYCTDVSAIPPETWPMLEGLDVFVIDGLRFRHHPTHQTVDRAIEVSRQVGATHSYLTHMSHDISHTEHGPAMPDGIELAHDGLCVTVHEDGAIDVNG